jgi:hypothetical protein
VGKVQLTSRSLLLTRVLVKSKMVKYSDSYNN